MKISNDVLAALSAADTEGSNLILASQMDRAMYAKVNKVLEAAGGKWNRKLKAHVFDGDAAERMEQILITGEVVVTKDDFDFFPTPSPLVHKLMVLAEILPGMKCLEPSAGLGAIANEMQRNGIVTCIEANPEMVRELTKMGMDAVAKDFLSCTLENMRVTWFDRIVMNPPFSKRRDIHHVMHALKFLRPGGRLVAVMSAGVKFREDALAKGFRAMLARSPGSRIIDNDPGAFKSSGTMVNTVTVVVQA